MHKKRKQFSFLTYLLAFLTLSFSPSVRALEIVISDNSSGSNEVAVNQSSEIQVNQNNEATIENNINSDSDTGNNSSVGNAQGDVQTVTGDIYTSVEVENSTNFSEVQVGCCETNSTNIKVSGNGQASVNGVSFNGSGSTNVNINQGSNITNVVNGEANTGKNSTSYNTGGNVKIDTGDIRVMSDIENIANLASVRVLVSNPSATINISENASYSQTYVSYNADVKNDVYQNFTSDIVNYVVWDLTTGGNIASFNSGENTEISTGDIDFNVFINNLADIGGVDIDCCKDIYDPGDDDNDNEPPAGNGGTASKDKANNGSSQGSVLPSAAATESGGPGIMGLSDTSSEGAQALIFWISLAFVAFGGKIITNELLPKTSLKKV